MPSQPVSRVPSFSEFDRFIPRSPRRAPRTDDVHKREEPKPAEHFHVEKAKLLVAAEGMGDPNFSKTVVLVGPRNPMLGRAGFIVNRRHGGTSVAEVVEKTLGKEARESLPEGFEGISASFGGPVPLESPIALVRMSRDKIAFAERLGVLRFGGLEDVFAFGVEEFVRLAIANETEQSSMTIWWRMFLTYSGWVPGQLEQEIDLGAWEVFEADLGFADERVNENELWISFQNQHAE